MDARVGNKAGVKQIIAKQEGKGRSTLSNTMQGQAKEGLLVATT